MCLPAIIPALAAIGGGSALAGGAAVAGVAGSLYSGLAQKQSADYQSEIAKNNAKIAERKATSAELQGQHQRDQLRIQYAQDRASGRAAYAGAGVQLGSGSVSAWDLSLRQMENADLETSRTNAAETASGFLDERRNFLSSAAASRQSGRNAVVGSLLSASGTLAKARMGRI